MTVLMKKQLRTTNQNIKKNTPRVAKKLAQRGVRADEAIIASVAKYYEALNKLAKE
jgi:hypothetical protein